MARFVTIASFLSPGEAHVARSRLEQADIPCYLTNEHLIGVQWVYATAVGGVELKVAEQDAAQALSLLHSTAPEPAMEEVLAAAFADADARQAWDDPEPVCPVCGSTDIRPRTRALTTILLSLIFMLPAPVQAKAMRCNACRHTWKPG